MLNSGFKQIHEVPLQCSFYPHTAIYKVFWNSLRNFLPPRDEHFCRNMTVLLFPTSLSYSRQNVAARSSEPPSRSSKEHLFIHSLWINAGLGGTNKSTNLQRSKRHPTPLHSLSTLSTFPAPAQFAVAPPQFAVAPPLHRGVVEFRFSRALVFHGASGIIAIILCTFTGDSSSVELPPPMA
ncbi:UNVERIFIED_CONTAM: hypothetical protein K2H54_047756 [Gekko kuhli]